eukprot:COSAG01_NODE_6855_length_3468_cov_11.336302_4_plen_495_part_00
MRVCGPAPDAMMTTRALSALLLPVVVAALLLISPALAQPLAPPAGSTGTCDLSTVQARINTFNTECCTTAVCFAGGACSIGCADVLLPLLTDCMQFLRAVYGSVDGALNGTSDVFTAGARACTSTPAPLAPPGGNGATCDFTALSARVVSFNTACCTGPTCFADGACSVDCAMELLPLIVDCGAILDSIYDNTDGTYDGNVTMLRSGSQACLAISGATALERVQDLHDAGQCPDSVLDGVAETQVTAPCNDINPHCASFLTMGLACPTLQGQCDATCNFCTPSGGGHRRAQGTNLACNISTFSADAARVSSVCCDTTGGVCATGVPTTCDAKCAVFYVDFYDRCRDYINVQNTPTTQTSLAQLHTTCGQALPVEPLLLAAARCSGWTPGSATPAPPQAVPHCAPGWTGLHCETAPDPHYCASTPCQNGGMCIDTIHGYTCACIDRYTGNQCQNAPLKCLSTNRQNCYDPHSYCPSHTYDRSTCTCYYRVCDCTC